MMTAQQKQLIRALASRFTRADLARMVGVPYGSVFRFMAYHEIPACNKKLVHGLPPAPRIMKMVAMYLEGQTLQQIATQFDITRERVRQLIKRQGVTGANSGQGKKKVKGPKFKLTDIDKYWARVSKHPGHGPNGDCWLWVGSGNGKDGSYGKVRFRGAYCSTRAIALFLRDRKWHDPGLVVGATCKEGRCVNPDHLFTGTPEEIIFSNSWIYRRNKKIRDERHGQSVGQLSSDQEPSVPGEIPATIGDPADV